MHPVTALFAVLLMLGTFHLPPYLVNAEHWFPFVAAASAIRHGDWPLIGGFDSGYGLLCPAFLAVWLAGFGVSKLSLSALVMLSNVIAGTASFVLIRALTSSPFLALVGALYPLQGIDEMTALNARTFAVSSTFRAPVQIAIGSLLLYLCLRDRRGRIWPAFLFGVTVLWNPAFGAFAAVGFLAAQGYRMLHATGNERAFLVRIVLAMLAGIAIPLALIAALGRSAAPGEWYATTAARIELDLLGYANQAQQFDPIVTAAFIAGALCLALLLRRISRGGILTTKYLFVGASVIAAVPYGAYALARSDPTHYLPAYWCLIPSLALFASGFFRLFSMRSTLAAPLRASRWPRSGAAATIVLVLAAGALWWSSFPFERILAPTQLAASYQRFERPGAHPAGAAPVDVDPRLIAACRAGFPVLSYSDAWIYALGDCYSPLRVPAVAFLTRRSQVERASRELAARDTIVFDQTRNAYADWRGGMLDDIKQQLVRQGFAEASGCGRFSVLSRGGATPVLRKLCP
jgi:hypothetical protein